MSESRIQDWIRYVQENAENVAGTPAASTREDEVREAGSEEIASPTSREESTSSESADAKSGAQAAQKRVADSLRARRIASSREAGSEEIAPEEIVREADAPQTPDAEAAPRGGGNAADGIGEKAMAAPLPRRRIRPETRAQMLDRLTNPTISLHETSVILGVCSATVRRLCDAGALPHERTAGGQRRFRLADVMKLYRARHGEKTSR